MRSGFSCAPIPMVNLTLDTLICRTILLISFGKKRYHVILCRVIIFISLIVYLTTNGMDLAVSLNDFDLYYLYFYSSWIQLSFQLFIALLFSYFGKINPQQP